MSESLHAQLEIQDVVPPKKTTFDVIPIEILFMIVQDEVLQPQDHYNLALMSKTLNLICLPLYFKAYGMEYPHFRVDIHGGDMNEALMKGRRVMAGLYAAVYLRPIPTLVFVLRFRPDSQVAYGKVHFDRLRARLASATYFIRAIHSLDDVVIIGDEEWQWNTGQGPLSDFLLQEWVTVMGDFMNALLEKGCTSLQVLRGRRIVDSYAFHRTPATKIRHGVQSLLRQALPLRSDTPEDFLNGLRGSGWEFRRPRNQGYSKNITMKASAAVLRATVLRRFHIHSAQFLLPPHLSWTLGVLRSSPNLTSLSFANITFDEPRVWDAVMTLIQQAVTPSLRELAFPDFCDNITNIDFVMKFLNKLENLEHLELGMLYDRLIPTAVPFNANAVLLPNLRSLSAPIKVSNYLLGARPWEHNRLIKTWRTFYKNSDIKWDHEPLATQHFNALFSNLSRVLRHRERSSNESLKILMKLVPTYDFYGFESNPQVLKTIKPLGGVDRIVVPDGTLVYSFGDEADSRLATFLSTIFPDAVQVESKLVHPAIVKTLSNGRVPPALRSLLDWLTVLWPSVERVVLGSWVLNNISKGRDNIYITTKVEDVYQLWEI